MKRSTGMGFIRRRQLQHAVAVARARFYRGSGINGTGAVVVDLEGETSSIVHLPAAYLDETLLRGAKDDSLRLIAQVEEMIATARQPGAGWQVGASPLVADWDGDVVCVTETAMQPTYATFTKFAPRLRAPSILHLAFFAYWDAVIELAGEEASALGPSIAANLGYQLQHYRDHGLPRVLGKAVMFSAMRGASDRMADEIGASVGISGSDLRRLPRRERERIISEHTHSGNEHRDGSTT